MVLVRPVTRTRISTETFGHPVYDALIRTGASRSGSQASFANNVYATVVWSTVVTDTGGFIASSSAVVIPNTARAGLYAISYAFSVTTANPTSYISVYAGGVRYDINGTGSGQFAATIVAPLAVGQTVYLSMWNGSGGTLIPTASSMSVFRVGL